MMAKCRGHAGHELKARLPDIDTKYEGQRTDGTHAVNGTWRSGDRVETFQCSFDRHGRNIISFVVSKAHHGAVPKPVRQGSHDAKVDGGPFHATGEIPCARGEGQPMRNCRFGVVRKDRAKGNASVTVFWPDGGSRVITFEDATPVSYDQSEADAGAKMTFGKSGDVYLVTIGTQRFEIFEAIVTGG